MHIEFDKTDGGISWSPGFEDPIALLDGRQLVTLTNARAPISSRLPDRPNLLESNFIAAPGGA
jgi:hypothetical protein